MFPIVKGCHTFPDLIRLITKDIDFGVKIANCVVFMRITTPGLCAIACLTCVLWGCIFFEHRTLAHARAEADRALSEIRSLQLKKHVIPATTPAREPRHAGPVMG